MNPENKMNDMDLHELIDLVIKQIKNDFQVGDYTAIVELLLHTPRANLIGFLPEEETK
jgi:hypothetical protein